MLASAALETACMDAQRPRIGQVAIARESVIRKARATTGEVD